MNRTVTAVFLSLLFSVTASAQNTYRQNGGSIQDDAFPMLYEVDYVRVWQKK